MKRSNSRLNKEIRSLRRSHAQEAEVCLSTRLLQPLRQQQPLARSHTAAPTGVWFRLLRKKKRAAARATTHVATGHRFPCGELKQPAGQTLPESCGQSLSRFLTEGLVSSSSASLPTHRAV